MRTYFVAACALALAASGLARAQQIAFPGAAFRGGNTDWQVVLDTREDGTVRYRLKVSEAVERQTGGLEHRQAQAGEFELVGAIGVERTALTVKIAPVPLGSDCKLKDGSMGGAYGRYTYTIRVLTDASRLRSSAAGAWPKEWSGCGNFTLD